MRLLYEFASFALPIPAMRRQHSLATSFSIWNDYGIGYQDTAIILILEFAKNGFFL